MRDLEQVKRAERAATALERAWLQWRVRHGLSTGQLPPVSSYVGYSVEEPWGQPRVVFGLEAEEAERLAAILDGQDYVGPVHAEVTWPERRRQESSQSPLSLHGTAAGVPPQAADPDAGRLDASGRPDAAGRAIAAQFAAAPPRQSAAAPARQSSAAPDDLTAEQPILPAALRQAAAVADLPAELPEDAAARLQDLTARGPGRPGLVALRPRPATPPESLPAEVPAQPESLPESELIVPASPPGLADSSARAGSSAPSDSSASGDASAPSDSSASGDESGPSDSAASGEASAPAESSAPAGSSAPAESSAPAGSSAPGDPPAAGDSAAPAASEEPGVPPEPRASAGPQRHRRPERAEPVTRQFGEPAPWWQGTPFEQTAARVAEATGAHSEDQVAVARLFPVSRLNRGRKPSAGAPEAGPWPAAGGKAAAGAD
jgi:hypothetical protein